MDATLYQPNSLPGPNSEIAEEINYEVAKMEPDAPGGAQQGSLQDSDQNPLTMAGFEQGGARDAASWEWDMENPQAAGNTKKFAFTNNGTTLRKTGQDDQFWKDSVIFAADELIMQGDG